MPARNDYWDPRNPVQKADRLRFHQRRRLVCGLHLCERLSALHGCLLQGQGAGKSLKVVPLHTESLPIPEVIATLLQKANSTSDSIETQTLLPFTGICDMETLQAVQADLGLLAETLVQQMMAQAGQASDQILLTCLSDPGLLHHSEGQRRYRSLIDAEALAFQTGVNVVDHLPGKDLLAGGHGWPLNAMPLWMIWADRKHPIATEARLLVDCREHFVATLLPPSDGLDAEFPRIEQRWLPGMGCLPPDADMEWVDSGAPPARAIWEEPSTLPLYEARQRTLQDWEHRLSCKLKSCPQAMKELLSFWMGGMEKMLREAISTFESVRVVVVAEPEVQVAIVAALKNRHPQLLVGCSEEFGCPSQQHEAVVAATHGFLHMDQMPCNLPWITGTDIPRILGRLTPGTPSRYRNLLVEMSDYRPPVMKLREAI